MDFPGRDSNYGAIFFMQTDDFEGVLTTKVEIIVRFVSIRLLVQMGEYPEKTYRRVRAASFGPGI